MDVHLCPAAPIHHGKPKNCPALDETMAMSLRSPPTHITITNSKSLDLALRACVSGFSKPRNRRIIIFLGAKMTTETLIEELLSQIALNASIDSNRVYCINTTVLSIETCAFRRVLQLASKKGNLVVVLLNAAADVVVSLLHLLP
jgi:hypothetical protein